MQVHRVLPTRKILDNCALTIGTFDGVHRGHQLLINRLKEESDARGLQTAALTFEDMPICLLRPEVCPLLLTLADEKIAAFAQTPLDHLFIVPFTREIAGQRAREWMQGWLDNIGLKLFVGGPDFALGRDREGTIDQMVLMGQEMNFEALSLGEKLLEGDIAISSTRCRQVIERGEVERASAFLGRTYRLSGRVVGGQQLGRTIGFPTINFETNPRKCLPPHGVYAARVFWDDQSFLAALNIGMRPTVNGLSRQMEFHVIDQNIINPPSQIEIEFTARIRDEKKFADLDALKFQLKRDVQEVRALLSEIL